MTREHTESNTFDRDQKIGQPEYASTTAIGRNTNNPYELPEYYDAICKASRNMDFKFPDDIDFDPKNENNQEYYADYQMDDHMLTAHAIKTKWKKQLAAERRREKTTQRAQEEENIFGATTGASPAP